MFIGFKMALYACRLARKLEKTSEDVKFVFDLNSLFDKIIKND